MSGALARLFRDNAGNTLAIVGAALIPITAMIGSGLDMSRAYMAKSRMQSACDAASLAARRVMKNDNLSAEVLETGNRFFDFNFPQGLYQTEEFEPAITRPDTGLVRISAETRIPTTVMRLFGFGTLPLEVSCESSLNFVNTDVVLVLDVTGSMDDRVGGTKKINALRDAVMALYDELAPVQTQLQSQGLRLRYGVVPYSSTVNVGRLIYAVDNDYITSSTTYQSRVANFSNIATGSPARYNFSNWSYREATLDTSSFKAGGAIKLATEAPRDVLARGSSYNLQDLATFASRTTTTRWNGCIEERRTDPTITGSSNFTIPSGAFDLDINLVPDSDDTRWRPMMPEAVYTRASGNTVPSSVWTPSASSVSRTATTNWQMNYDADQGYYACPYESRRLDEWERGDLDEYLDELQPIGGTYHDIGMIWGARLISTGGIFGDGCEEYNGMPCNRHVIFMTDGQQTAYCNVYSTYGVERNDKRVMGANSCTSDSYNAAGVPTDSETRNLLARHAQRFRMICNATKNMDVSVWVVAFDTALNANLVSCASNSSQATTSTNADELIESFREIGNKIGALRLTK